MTKDKPGSMRDEQFTEEQNKLLDELCDCVARLAHCFEKHPEHALFVSMNVSSGDGGNSRGNNGFVGTTPNALALFRDSYENMKTSLINSGMTHIHPDFFLNCNSVAEAIDLSLVLYIKTEDEEKLNALLGEIKMTEELAERVRPRLKGGRNCDRPECLSCRTLDRMAEMITQFDEESAVKVEEPLEC